MNTLTDWLSKADTWLGPLDSLLTIASLIIAAVIYMAKRNVQTENRDLADNNTQLKLERDQAEALLEAVDPDTFLRKAKALYDDGDYDAVEKLAEDFTTRQTKAFGRAAEYLAEQRLLDSDTHPEAAADAIRFASIGLAADPDSKRLTELQTLARKRKAAINRGEPIEALNMEGLSADELFNVSQALVKKGNYALAEIAAQRRLALVRTQNGSKSIGYATALNWHAQRLLHLASLDASLSQADFAEQVFKSAFPSGYTSRAEYAGILNTKASVLHDQGKLAEAEALFREALEIGKATIGTAHPDYATWLTNLGSVLWDQGKLAEAEALYREALQILREALPEDHPNIAKADDNLRAVQDQIARKGAKDPADVD